MKKIETDFVLVLTAVIIVTLAYIVARLLGSWV